MRDYNRQQRGIIAALLGILVCAVFLTGARFSDVLPASIIRGLRLDGPLYHKVTRTAASYTVLSGDNHVEVTSTSAARTITIPAALCTDKDFILTVSDASNLTNPITIAPAGSVTIDGKNDLVLRDPYESVTLYSNGTNLFTKYGVAKGFLKTSPNLNASALVMYDESDDFIFPISKSGAVTFDISSDSEKQGHFFFVSDISADTSADIITIRTDSGAKIDTLDEYQMRGFYNSVGLFYDGAGWRTLAGRSKPSITLYGTGSQALDATADIAMCAGCTFTIDDDLRKIGRTYTLKDTSTDSLVVDPEGSTTIDGATTITITTDYGIAEVFSDGASWWTKSRY